MSCSLAGTRCWTQTLTTPTRAAQASYTWTNDGRLQTLTTTWNGGVSRGLHYVYGGTGEGPVVGLAHHGHRPMRERSGPPGGMKAQTRPTVTNTAQHETPLATFSGRDALGRATAIDLNGGAAIDTNYDLLGRVDTRQVTAASGDWRRKTYAYDARGRVEGVLNEFATAPYTADTFVYDGEGPVVRFAPRAPRSPAFCTRSSPCFSWRPATCASPVRCRSASFRTPGTVKTTFRPASPAPPSGAIGGTTTAPTVWYADVDGDGYGDANTTAGACDAPPGFVANFGDCADEDAQIHSGADE